MSQRAGKRPPMIIVDDNVAADADERSMSTHALAMRRSYYSARSPELTPITGSTSYTMSNYSRPSSMLFRDDKHSATVEQGSLREVPDTPFDPHESFGLELKLAEDRGSYIFCTTSPFSSIGADQCDASLGALSTSVPMTPTLPRLPRIKAGKSLADELRRLHQPLVVTRPTSLHSPTGSASASPHASPELRLRKEWDTAPDSPTFDFAMMATSLASGQDDCDRQELARILSQNKRRKKEQQQHQHQQQGHPVRQPNRLGELVAQSRAASFRSRLARLQATPPQHARNVSTSTGVGAGARMSTMSTQSIPIMLDFDVSMPVTPTQQTAFEDPNTPFLTPASSIASEHYVLTPPSRRIIDVLGVTAEADLEPNAEDEDNDITGVQLFSQFPVMSKKPAAEIETTTTHFFSDTTARPVVASAIRSSSLPEVLSTPPTAPPTMELPKTPSSVATSLTTPTVSTPTPTASARPKLDFSRLAYGPLPDMGDSASTPITLCAASSPAAEKSIRLSPRKPTLSTSATTANSPASGGPSLAKQRVDAVMIGGRAASTASPIGPAPAQFRRRSADDDADPIPAFLRQSATKQEQVPSTPTPTKPLRISPLRRPQLQLHGQSQSQSSSQANSQVLSSDDKKPLSKSHAERTTPAPAMGSSWDDDDDDDGAAKRRRKAKRKAEAVAKLKLKQGKISGATSGSLLPVAVGVQTPTMSKSRSAAAVSDTGARAEVRARAGAAAGLNEEAASRGAKSSLPLPRPAITTQASTNSLATSASVASFASSTTPSTASSKSSSGTPTATTALSAAQAQTLAQMQAPSLSQASVARLRRYDMI